jgi:hypothetical protein
MKNTTYLFSCQPLSEFIKSSYSKQSFNGVKIIATPKTDYFISVITLDSKKYTNESLMDRVALIKAKQQANTLFNHRYEDYLDKAIHDEKYMQLTNENKKALLMKEQDKIKEKIFREYGFHYKKEKKPRLPEIK